MFIPTPQPDVLMALMLADMDENGDQVSPRNVRHELARIDVARFPGLAVRNHITLVSIPHDTAKFFAHAWTDDFVSLGYEQRCSTQKR